MVPSITQTKGGLVRRKAWFTEHEEKILVNRLLRDDPGKSSMGNRQVLSLGVFWQALCDYHACKCKETPPGLVVTSSLPTRMPRYLLK